MRLQKYLAQCGVASRRKAEELILQGRVKVNGKVVVAMGCLVDPDNDLVEFDSRPVGIKDSKIYIMLNKPTGVITSAKDEKGRKTVLDIVNLPERLYPVGRLDFMTEGLVILTNDGDFSYLMTHPKHKIYKKYLAFVKGSVSEAGLRALKNGIEIEGRITAPARVEIIKRKKESSLIQIEIHEGRNRQVRKMCEAIGHPVTSLKRVSVGLLELGELKKGQWRHLLPKEVKQLKEMCSSD